MIVRFVNKIQICWYVAFGLSLIVGVFMIMVRKCDKSQMSALKSVKWCQWLCCGKHHFRLNIVTLFATQPVKPLLIYTDVIKLCAKRLACDRKIMCGTIHSSNKKGHKTWGPLLKSMDYIIEWNAPAPICASQASLWLFPGSIARVLRLYNTAAGRALQWLCARLAPPFK